MTVATVILRALDRVRGRALGLLDSALPEFQPAGLSPTGSTWVPVGTVERLFLQKHIILFRQIWSFLQLGKRRGSSQSGVWRRWWLRSTVPIAIAW